VQAGACSSDGGTHATTRSARLGRTRTIVAGDVGDPTDAAATEPPDGTDTVTEPSVEPDAVRRTVGAEPVLTVALADCAVVTGPTVFVNVLVAPPGPVAVSRTFR
jgi:hypothetical protein